MVVSTTPAWGIEPTTSSLGAMSPYHEILTEELMPRVLTTKPRPVVPLDGTQI